MPYSEQNPSPKGGKWKIESFLASLIDLRVFIDVLIVDVLLSLITKKDAYLFKSKGKKARPTSPNSIIQHGKPISEKDLTRVPIEKSEVDFCSDQDNVLVEVITYHPADSTIAKSPMYQEQPMQMTKLTESIVSCSHSLSPFFTSDSYANVSFLDHWDVIGTITNS